MTTTTKTTTSQYGLGGAQHRSGSIMGVTHDARDNSIDAYILQNLIKEVLYSLY